MQGNFQQLGQVQNNGKGEHINENHTLQIEFQLKLEEEENKELKNTG